MLDISEKAFLVFLEARDRVGVISICEVDCFVIRIKALSRKKDVFVRSSGLGLLQATAQADRHPDRTSENR